MARVIMALLGLAMLVLGAWLAFLWWLAFLVVLQGILIILLILLGVGLLIFGISEIAGAGKPVDK